LFALLAVTVIWGWTFVWMKQAILAGEAQLGAAGRTATIGLYMTLRFGLAALILPLVSPAARRGIDLEVWKGGGVIGGLLLTGFLFQMFGLQDVSPAVSAFLTSLYVLFTVFLMMAIQRRLPHGMVLAGALSATLGAAFISGPPRLSFDRGEWLSVACAFIFALHILATDRITRRCAPMPVTLTTFIVVTAGSLVTLAWGFEGLPEPRLGALVELATTRAFAIPLLLSSIFATVLAISLMNSFQRKVEPVRAAILYAIEPAWAALIAIAVGLADPSPWLIFGGGALLAGNWIAELGAVRRR
jgi:drug/metabolite transporter (DMT)-like permease